MPDAPRLFDDPKARRRLCAALTEIIYAHGPDDADVVDLAEHTPSLTATEVEAVRAYFLTPVDDASAGPGLGAPRERMTQ